MRDIASLKSISGEEEEDLCDAWHDAHFRPLSLQQLYKDICVQVGIPVPQHPANALSKLRSMEQRCRIFPDSITLFYMKQMQKNIRTFEEDKPLNADAEESPLPHHRTAHGDELR